MLLKHPHILKGYLLWLAKSVINLNMHNEFVDSWLVQILDRQLRQTWWGHWTCWDSPSELEQGWKMLLHHFVFQLPIYSCLLMVLRWLNRILLTSTSEVYGDPLVHPQEESYWGNVNPIGIFICDTKVLIVHNYFQLDVLQFSLLRGHLEVGKIIVSWSFYRQTVLNLVIETWIYALSNTKLCFLKYQFLRLNLQWSVFNLFTMQ